MQIFQPMPLQRRAAPFDDPNWIYELKMDGFRALAVIEHGRAQLLSRNGHPFASFSALAESISDSLPNVRQQCSKSHSQHQHSDQQQNIRRGTHTSDIAANLPWFSAH